MVTPAAYAFNLHTDQYTRLARRAKAQMTSARSGVMSFAPALVRVSRMPLMRVWGYHRMHRNGLEVVFVANKQITDHSGLP